MATVTSIKVGNGDQIGTGIMAATRLDKPETPKARHYTSANSLGKLKTLRRKANK